LTELPFSALPFPPPAAAPAPGTDEALDLGGSAASKGQHPGDGGGDAFEKILGVLGTFVSDRRPFSSRATMSVKVPPMSMPICTAILLGHGQGTMSRCATSWTASTASSRLFRPLVTLVRCSCQPYCRSALTRAARRVSLVVTMPPSPIQPSFLLG
jgi:hypothetical protein